MNGFGVDIVVYCWGVNQYSDAVCIYILMDVGSVLTVYCGGNKSLQ